jgi:endo-beta-N-acetylglucosaminidase D
MPHNECGVIRNDQADGSNPSSGSKIVVFALGFWRFVRLNAFWVGMSGQ